MADVETSNISSILMNATTADNTGSHSQDMFAVVTKDIQVISFTLLPVLLVIGILGNVLTLVVMGLNEISSLASRYILTSLAVCDMTMLLTHVVNKHGVQQVIGIDLRAFSPIGCKIFFHIYRTTKMMSSWLVVLLCVERFIAVVLPLKVKVIITKKRVISLMLGIFLTLVIFNATWSFSAEITKSGKKLQCKQNVQTDDNRAMYKIFLIISNAIFSWIPIAVMSTLTPVIIHRLVKQQQKREQMSNTSKNGTEAARISAMLISVIIAYVIFILPVTIFHINNSFVNFGLQKNTVEFLIVREAVQYLEMMNYATNFIMYCFCSAAFRTKAKQLVCNCTVDRRRLGSMRSGSMRSGSMRSSSVRSTTFTEAIKADIN